MSSEHTRPDADVDLAEIHERLDELEKFKKLTDSRLDNINKSIENLHAENERLKKRVKRLNKKISISAEKSLDISNLERPLVEDLDLDDCPWIETKPEYRAVRIAEKFHDWSTGTKGGDRRLRVDEEGLRDLYEAAYDETLTSTDIRRAFRAAEELSDGTLLHEKQDGVNALRKPSDETLYTSMEEFETDVKQTDVED